MGGDGVLGVFAGVAVGGDGEAGFIEDDAAGGAGDVFEIEGEFAQDGGLANGAAELADAGIGEFPDDDIEVVEEGGGFAAGGEVLEVVAAKGLNTGVTLEAAEIAIIHWSWWWGLGVVF